MPKLQQEKVKAEVESEGLWDTLVVAADKLVGDVFDVADEALDNAETIANGIAGSADAEGDGAAGGEANGRSWKRAQETEVGDGRRRKTDAGVSGPVTINLGLGKLLREARELGRDVERKSTKPPATEEAESEESESTE